MRGMERIGRVTSLVWSFISGGVWNNRARVAGQRVIRQGYGGVWRIGRGYQSCVVVY